ncbi:ABC-type bacteriocin/lantibiotic exporter with N-terminal double-glycine peptidase domain [Nostoc sp. PCC 7524]|uniref:cysteine peptidase family C39 domain-containing protein n=1 Tax=Nostoc sp. (strain ATCC 29411 / PCC 7524) TaxID=28072 RepID=UPI00029F1A82|nr:peptidase domain-containing ABC transporter [Nostoc sp. PCC 7524]AFY49429.1 ABC-type bacteriocin/lantibiotic exporter with N-terminal double-glycine peptidase domain [Nostoc sp. PCC 7524]
MNPSSSLRVQGGLQNYASDQPFPTPTAPILKLVRLVAGDTSLAPEFSQAWVIHEFQLGDELTSYGLNQEIEDSNNIIYLVCQGRVRLLGFNPKLGREVSTQLLLAGQTFGADHLFFHQPLAYQAIAASPGYVAQITVSDLEQWLQRLPQLKNYLRQLTNERQALIFFKSCSDLQSLTSGKLRELLPLFVAQQIPVGSSLLEATPPEKGRFWLASGQVQSISVGSSPPLRGDSWGYPDLTPPDGNAQSDLLVYHLSPENWDVAKAIAPHLFTTNYKPTETKPTVKTINSKPEIRLPQLTHVSQRDSQADHPPSVIATSETSETETIDFPQGGLQPPIKPKFWYSYPFIQQQSLADCGAACLAMISQYWGKRLSLPTLRNLAQIDRLGATLQGLTTAAESLGYQVLPVRASLDKLEWQTNPWIAHWQGIHYVVVWQVKGDRLLISDPALGRRWLKRPKFEASWTGYALLLNPTEIFYTLKSEKVSLGRYGQTLWHYRKLLKQIILASLLVQVFGLVTPLCTQVVIDQMIPARNLETLNMFAVGYLCLGIWRIVLTAQHQYLLDYFASRIDLNLVASFVNYTLQLPLQFFASRQVEDILSRIQENHKIQLFITRRAIGATIDSFMVLIYLGLMTYYNWQLTLLVISWILPIVFLTVGVSSYIKQASREIWKESAGQQSAIAEMMTGIVTVKTATAERSLQKYWEEHFLKMLKARLRGQKLANRLQLTRSLINHVGSTLILWFGVSLVIGKQMSLGQFVAFNLLIGSVTNPVLALVGLWDEFQQVLISVERLNDVFTSTSEESSQTTLLVMPPIRGEVQLENVCFRYSHLQERYTLQNLSFRVQPGQIIGIIGQSGSGKSTLANLLAGLYHPEQGRMMIDGHDTSVMSPQSLRSQLGLVSQESFLFSGTILDNITLYDPELIREQAVAAAKLAGAHDFIQALPLGYDTPVAERGLGLSGGQRQKIAIARALIRNPKILVLDEVTIGLDAESEQTFQQNLALITQKRTTFIISHRISNVRHADYILVLDQGMIVEQGTHPELIAMTGLYQHLTQLQLHL